MRKKKEKMYIFRSIHLSYFHKCVISINMLYFRSIHFLPLHECVLPIKVLPYFLLSSFSSEVYHDIHNKLNLSDKCSCTHKIEQPHKVGTIPGSNYMVRGDLRRANTPG